MHGCRPELTESASDVDLSRELAEIACAAVVTAGRRVLGFNLCLRATPDDAIVGFAPIEPIGEGLFAPRPEDGRDALIVAATYHGHVLDLVADAPGLDGPLRRVGDAEALGLDDIEDCRLWRRPLLLVSTPARWLFHRHDTACACILDWHRARDALADVPSIVCSPPGLADVAWHTFNAPRPQPRISVLA